MQMDDDRISPMTQMRGVGSRPITLKTNYVTPTTLGGTVEKLEMGMTGVAPRAQFLPTLQMDTILVFLPLLLTLGRVR